MPHDEGRRNFLKLGLGAAAGATASLALPRAAAAASGGDLVTVFDLARCIGCEACVDACREQWQDTVPDPAGDVPPPFPSKVPFEDWSQKKDVQDRLTPYNFLYVEMLEVEHKGETLELNVPRRCMHCDNPPCANLCPFGAAGVQKNGTVLLDQDTCLGGAKCKSVCPWHIPQRQSGVGLYLNMMPRFAGNGVMFKCKRCAPLVAKGEKPRCVSICPENVQSIGPRESQIAMAVALAKEKAVADGASEPDWERYVYGLHENGGTSTIYVSPIPVAEVARAMDAQHKALAQEAMQEAKAKGKGQGPGKGMGFGPARLGKAHMHPVANSMASEEMLGKAWLIAPIAGLFAGIGHLAKLGRAASQDKGGDHAA